MPIYEYKCNNEECLKHFEKTQKFTSKAVAKCPSCNSKSTRQISGFSVQFKGSGWYSTANRVSDD
jgi:putative FmdB family regulatory protein